MSEGSFHRTWVTGVTGVCLLAILTSSAALFEARSLIASMTKEEKREGQGQDFEDARTLQLLGVRNIAAMRACLLTHDRASMPVASATSARMRTGMAQVQAGITEPAARALLAAAVDAEWSCHEAFVRAMAPSVLDRPSFAVIYAGEVVTRGARFDHALATLVAHLAPTRLDGLAPSQAVAKRSEFLLIAITVTTILLLAMLCVVLVAVLNRGYRLQLEARDSAGRGQVQARATP